MTKKFLLIVVLLLIFVTGCNSNKNFTGGYALVYKDDIPHLVNKNNEMLSLEKYDEIEDIFGEYIIVKEYRNNKLYSGYIDHNGKEIIKPKYDKAYPFNEGMAVVESKGIYKIINTKNEVLYTFDEGYASYDSFKDGYLRVEKDGLFTFLKYDGRNFELGSTFYLGLENYSDGYALYYEYVNNVKQFNFIDKSYNKLFKNNELAEYDFVDSFSEGYARVGRYIGTTYYYSYINNKGTILKDQNNNSLFTIARNFQNGYAVVYTNKPYYVLYSGDGVTILDNYYCYQYMKTDGSYPKFDYSDYRSKSNDINSIWANFYDCYGPITAIKYTVGTAGDIRFYKISDSGLVKINLNIKNINKDDLNIGYYNMPYDLIYVKDNAFYNEDASTILMVVKTQPNYYGIVTSDGSYVLYGDYDYIII